MRFRATTKNCPAILILIQKCAEHQKHRFRVWGQQLASSSHITHAGASLYCIVCNFAQYDVIYPQSFTLMSSNSALLVFFGNVHCNMHPLAQCIYAITCIYAAVAALYTNAGGAMLMCSNCDVRSEFFFVFCRMGFWKYDLLVMKVICGSNIDQIADGRAIDHMYTVFPASAQQ